MSLPKNWFAPPGVTVVVKTDGWIVADGEYRTFVPRFKAMPADTRFFVLDRAWVVAMVDVSPELALEFIQRKSPNQRNEKLTSIERLAKDMTGGTWTPNHQGMAFDRDGVFEDGQNRTGASVAHDVPFTTLVFFGIGVYNGPEMQTTDLNVPRSMRDSAKIGELDLPNEVVSAVTSAVVYGVRSGRHRWNVVPRLQRLRVMSHFSDLAVRNYKLVHGTALAPKMRLAPLMGAMLCASYTVSEEKLARFSKILIDEDAPAPHETAARALRVAVTSRSVGSNSDEARFDLFLKTARAIQAFAAGKPMDKIMAPRDNPYPLDSEYARAMGENPTAPTAATA